MDQTPSTEQVRLVVAPHFNDHITRGWRQFILLFALSAIHAVSPTLFWWIIGAILLIGFAVGARLLRKKKENTHNPAEPARLQCFGNPDELDRIRSLGSQFFEPFVVQSSPFLLPGGVKKMPFKRTLYFMTTGGVVVFIFSGAGYSPNWTMAFLSLVFLVILFITYHAVPTYYRVSPGRLDILSSKLFSTKLILKSSWPLRQTEIVCRRGGELLIQVPGGESERIYLTDFSLEDEEEFVEMLFTAAISQHETPNLPTSELTG